MTELSSVLTGRDLGLMLWTAGILGILHTLMGPDHYVPFVMMSRSERWPLRKTMWITGLCGLGHVGSSIVIGLVLGLVGMAASTWEGSAWNGWHEARGDVSAWLLMGIGVVFFLYALMRRLRGQTHCHGHPHESETWHEHVHGHEGAHVHSHADRSSSRLTPWVLFTVFVFGPCESLIPLMLAATAVAGVPGSLLVAVVFSVTTVVTINVTVFLLLAGFQKLSLRFLEVYAGEMAGLSLVLCGAGIRFFGL